MLKSRWGSETGRSSADTKKRNRVGGKRATWASSARRICGSEGKEREVQGGVVGIEKALPPGEGGRGGGLIVTDHPRITTCDWPGAPMAARQGAGGPALHRGGGPGLPFAAKRPLKRDGGAPPPRRRRADGLFRPLRKNILRNLLDTNMTMTLRSANSLCARPSSNSSPRVVAPCKSSRPSGPHGHLLPARQRRPFPLPSLAE